MALWVEFSLANWRGFTWRATCNHADCTATPDGAEVDDVAFFACSHALETGHAITVACEPLPAPAGAT